MRIFVANAGSTSPVTHRLVLFFETASYLDRLGQLDENSMNLKWKALTALSLAVLATTGIAAYWQHRDNQALIAAAERRELDLVASQMRSALESQMNKASARAALVASLPPVREAFRARETDKLLKLLESGMQLQRDEFGVREAHFALAPATSFLRIFDPSAPSGEDMSSFRPMLVAAHNTQEPQSGLSVGRRGLSIRGVRPIADSEGPVGSFEIGMSFTDVLDQIREVVGFEAAVFVDDDLMREVATRTVRPDSERIIGIYQVLEATNWEAIKPLISASLLADTREVRFETPTIGDTAYGLVLMPLLSPTGKRIGVLVASHPLENYRKQSRLSLTYTLAGIALQIFILGGVLMIVINGMFMRPLRALAEIATNTSGNNVLEREHLLRRTDEFGEIAKQLEAGVQNGNRGNTNA